MRSRASQARPRTAAPALSLQELHARAQAFLYFFVDAASAIDPEDPQWDVYLALERSPDGVEFVSQGAGTGDPLRGRATSGVEISGSVSLMEPPSMCAVRSLVGR